MSKGKGIAGIITFFILTMISIGINTVLEPSFSSEEAAMILLGLSILLWTLGFLIPGILCLLEYKPNKALILLYMIIPCILLCFLIYTIIILSLASSTFMSTFQEFMGLGVSVSIVLGIIMACYAYAQSYA